MIGPPCASMPSRVLNAFRHHGLYRLSAIQDIISLA